MSQSRMVQANTSIEKGETCKVYRRGRKWLVARDVYRHEANRPVAYERVALRDVKQGESVAFDKYDDTRDLKLPSAGEVYK